MASRFPMDEPDPSSLRRSPGRVPMDLEARRYMKVNLPVRHHLRLQAMRLLGDDSISQTVERALDLYFEAELAQAGVRAAPVPAGDGARPEGAAAEPDGPTEADAPPPAP